MPMTRADQSIVRVSDILKAPGESMSEYARRQMEEYLYSDIPAASPPAHSRKGRYKIIAAPGAADEYPEF